MKYCVNCGNEMIDDMRFCPNCGTSSPDNPVGEESAAETKAADKTASEIPYDYQSFSNIPEQQSNIQNNISYVSNEQQDESVKPKNIKQFTKIYGTKEIKSNIKWGYLVLYIAAAATFLLGIAQAGNNGYYFLVDVFILLGLGVWLQLTYSRIPAAIAFAYAVFNTLFIFITEQVFSGGLIIIGTVFCLINVFKAHKKYKEYLTNPDNAQQAVTDSSDTQE